MSERSILRPNRIKRSIVMEVEAGRVLISEPFLPDPNFSRSVVFITEHSEAGTLGYVLNQRTDLTVDTVMPELGAADVPLFQGGPVDLESFHYLHRYSEIEGSTHVSGNIYWGGDFEQVKLGLETGVYDKENFIFLVGYSGWAEGQLAMELEERSWIVGELSEDLIFDRTIDDSDLWKHAIRRVDGDDSLLANSPINPYLN